MTEADLLNHCCKQIEKELNWGPPERWSNQDFENLSDQIAGRTKIKLSVSRLKRVWGKVNYESLPSAATLNALAQFNGYESWRAYWQNNNVPEEEIVMTTTWEAKHKPWWQRPALRKTIFMIALILLGLLMRFIFQLSAR